MQTTTSQSSFSATPGLTFSFNRNNQDRCFARGLLVSVFAAFIFSTITIPTNAADAVNEITAIIPGDNVVRIQVTSTRYFPMRAMRPLLHIGAATFRKSMPAPSGSANELVFLVPVAEYAKLKNDAAVSVDYEGNRPDQQRWEFGVLQK